MGGFCSKCYEEQEINMEEIGGWIKAVNDGNKGAMEFLYLDDPSVLEKSVNKDQQKAIHITIIKNNKDILEWLLLQSAFNINIQDRYGNSALHLSSQLGYSELMEILLSHNADFNLVNKKKLKPIDICHKDCKSILNIRNIKKLIQNQKNKNGNINNPKKKRLSDSEQILINGVSIESHHFQKDNDAESHHSLEKKARTVQFAKLTTSFGFSIGIEVEDIVDFLNKVGDKQKLWKKFLSGEDKEMINKERDLYKIVVGLSMAVLKRKNPRANKPPTEPIKDLLNRLKIKLQTKRLGNNFELTKEKFTNDFSNILTEISQDMKTTART